MSNPKDRANDPNRKSAHTHTDEELLAKFNEIHARVTAQPVIKDFSYDTVDSRRSWSMPDGKP
jgi:hypothetical protein